MERKISMKVNEKMLFYPYGETMNFAFDGKTLQIFFQDSDDEIVDVDAFNSSNIMFAYSEVGHIGFLVADFSDLG